MVSPADRRYAALQLRSASDTNFRCSKGKWFRLRKPGLHRFLISGPNLRIDARISLFKPSFVHRFLISSPDLGIDASFSRFKPSCVHRFLISGPNLGIDASFSPFSPSFVHRFLISGPDLGIDARISPKTTFCVHRFLISGPNLGIDAAPSLLHRRMARLQHSRWLQVGTGCHEGGIILRKKPPEWHLSLPQRHVASGSNLSLPQRYAASGSSLSLPRQRYASDSNPAQFIGRNTKKRLSTM